MIEIRSQKGFTLLELLLVISIIGIFAAIALPRLGGVPEKAKMAVDQTALRNINYATTLYSISNKIVNGDIFEAFNTDKQRMKELVNKSFLDQPAKPESAGAKFIWLKDEQIWVLISEDIIAPKTPLGSSFAEIMPNMTALIVNKKKEGGYGRTWDDYRYTDIGLDPAVWKDAIDHIHYKPIGSRVEIEPEDGYKFLLVVGNKEIKMTDGWTLKYFIEEDKWYHHKKLEENIIYIDTLKIEPKSKTE